MPPPFAIREEVVGDLLAATRRGHSLSLAAEAAGVTDRTVYRWLNRGRQDLEAGDVGTPFARLCRDLARARLEVAGPLIDAARDAALEEPEEGARPRDVRGILSVLKTLLPRHHGKGAAAEAAKAEADALASETASSATQAVELVRCGHCGEDQLPGKRFCGDCALPMGAGGPSPPPADSDDA